MPERKWTPIEQRIIDLMSDGMPHSRLEIIQCTFDPEYTEWNAMLQHIMHINHKLKGTGTVIHCVRQGMNHSYRHVRLLVPDHIA